MTKSRLFKRIAQSFPNLTTKLREAGMEIEPEAFVKKTFLSAFYLTTMIMFIAALVLIKTRGISAWFYVLVPVVFALLFLYFMKLPDVKALVKRRSLDSEVLDATRYLIIELESSIPLYESIDGVARSFDKIGVVFYEIITEVNTGTDMEVAISTVANFTPSEKVRRVLWQILNSLQTGANVGTALKEIVDQIAREQLVESRVYGRKLNPIAMFYMMIAVIIPSLGVTMLTVLSSFVSIRIELLFLILLAVGLGLIQFMFLAVIKSSRPAVHI